MWPREDPPELVLAVAQVRPVAIDRFLALVFGGDHRLTGAMEPEGVGGEESGIIGGLGHEWSFVLRCRRCRSRRNRPGALRSPGVACGGPGAAVRSRSIRASAKAVGSISGGPKGSSSWPSMWSVCSRPIRLPTAPGRRSGAIIVGLGRSAPVADAASGAAACGATSRCEYRRRRPPRRRRRRWPRTAWARPRQECRAASSRSRRAAACGGACLRRCRPRETEAVVSGQLSGAQEHSGPRSVAGASRSVMVHGVSSRL